MSLNNLADLIIKMVEDYDIDRAKFTCMKINSLCNKIREYKRDGNGL
jgi:hypothetical protein